MFLSKLIRFHSTNSIFKPKLSSKSANFIENRINAKHSDNDTCSVTNVLKFDELKSLYQKQSKSQAILFDNFEEIPHISTDLLIKLNQNGIVKPTEIQKNMLGHFFGSKSADLLVKSLPGSGKSIGYIITLLADYYGKAMNQINLIKCAKDGISCKYLIIVPTELLAKQLYNWIHALKTMNDTVSVSVLCETFTNLEAGKPSDFLIATPEAFRTKMAQGLVDFRGLETVVLDEADALIKPLKRFASVKQKDIRAKHPVTSLMLLSEMMKTFTVNKLYKRPRMIVSSATLNKLTRDQLVSSEIVKDPIFIEDKQPIVTKIENINPSDSNVIYYHSLLKDPQNPDELVEILSKIIGQNPSKCGALFLPASQSKLGLCELLKSSKNRHKELEKVSIELLCQKQGNESQDKLYIASDVDCRGIDIPELSYVIILDLPSSLDKFIHMSGRVGRMGQVNSGNVYTILGTLEDFNRFTSLIRQIHLTTIPFVGGLLE